MNYPLLTLLAFLGAASLEACGAPPNYHDSRNNPSDCPAAYPITNATPVSCNTTSTCWYGDANCNPSCYCSSPDGGGTGMWVCAACD